MASRTLTLQAVANAAGVATITKQPPSGYWWTLGHIGVTSTSALLSTCSVYQNKNFICGSDSGNSDAADGTPMNLKDTDELEIIWSNCTPAATCYATLITEEDPHPSGTQ